MNFLAPFAFAFAATLPVVVVFYLLKRKRVVKLVPSTLLWQKYLAETQASAPFQRLRHNWLLILQLLLLLLAILALARPYFAAKAKSGRTLVAILDASASMQSTDETPTRFEKARKQALELVGSMHPQDSMVVLVAGGNTEVKQSATTEKAALRRAIESSQSSDSPTRLNEALKLASTLVQNNTLAEVHLFSDGATDSLLDFESKGLPLVYHNVGTRHVNVGIVNLDVRSNPDNPAQRAVFATFQNASTNEQQVQAELLFENTVLDVKVLTLKPKEASPQVFLADQPHDGVFTVRLQANDDLAADNTASVMSLLPQPVKVLLVTPGNRYLEKALKAVPTVELATVNQLTDSAEDFDVVVLDTVVPVTFPKANVLAVNVANTNWFEGGVKTLEAPPIVDWRTGHPLLRFVNFDNVQVVQSLQVKAPSWALSLVESPATPLIVAGELQQQRIVWIGFDFLQSSWPRRISFPIFIANAVDWLNPASERASQLMVKAGDSFRVRFANEAPEAEITLPGGSKRSRALDTKRELVFGDTHKQGVYKVTAGTNQVTFCVNLLDASETDTTPRPEIQLGDYAKVTTSKTRQASLEIWRWFALAALLVLMFEWWYYHRRTA